MAIEHIKVTHTQTFDDDNFDLVNAFPGVIPSGVSMELTLTLLQTSGDPIDCTGATVIWKGRPESSPISFLNLDTGSVGGAGNNVLSFVMDKDTLPDGWALYPAKVRMQIDVENGAGVHLAKFYQRRLTVLSDEDDADINYPYTEDVGISFEVYDSDTSETAKPGFRLIFLDTSGGAVAYTLPEAGSYDGQAFKIKVIGATAGTVTPYGAQTINGVAGAQTLAQWDHIELYEYNGNWIAANPSITVP